MRSPAPPPRNVTSVRADRHGRPTSACPSAGAEATPTSMRPSQLAGDERGPDRDAAREVMRPIDRVDDPLQGAVRLASAVHRHREGGSDPSSSPKHGMVGEPSEDASTQQRLGLGVRERDERAVRLTPHLAAASVVAHRVRHRPRRRARGRRRAGRWSRSSESRHPARRMSGKPAISVPLMRDVDRVVAVRGEVHPAERNDEPRDACRSSGGYRKLHLAVDRIDDVAAVGVDEPGSRAPSGPPPRPNTGFAPRR